MGMFDYVNFKLKCPRCGKMINEFQTKDGPQLLIKLDFWDVKNFYNSCSACRSWVEFTLKKRPNRKLKVSDYKKTVKITTPADDKKYKRDMERLFGSAK